MGWGAVVQGGRWRSGGGTRNAGWQLRVPDRSPAPRGVAYVPLQPSEGTALLPTP